MTIDARPKEQMVIERQLLDLAYRSLPTMIAITLLCAAGATALMSEDGLEWAGTWFAAVLVLTIARLGIWRWHYESERRGTANFARSKLAYSAGLWASGLCWSVATWSMGPTGSSSHYALTVIVSALSAGATAMVAQFRRTGQVYVCLLVVPAAITMLLAGGGVSIVGGLALAFCCAMLAVLNGNHTMLRATLMLEHQNSGLIAELKALNLTLERKVAERTGALETIAGRDALTGLANRRALKSWMTAQLDTIAPHGATIMFLDLDRFKQINDAMGHEVGDRVLLTTAGRLSTTMPEEGILARWGGDEFIAVLPTAAGSADGKPCCDLADRMIAAVGLPIQIDSRTVSVGLSIGVANYPRDAASVDGVILAADLAVAEVKRMGRGHVLAYSQAFAETRRRRFDIGRALAEGGVDLIELHYQPIICARSGEVVRMEALARWSDDQLGPVDPAEFIKIAEEADLIVPIGKAILDKACRDAAHWRTRLGEASPQVAVNISIAQLLAPDFPAQVLKLLTATGLPAAHLHLEVTESLFDEDHFEAMLTAVTSLRFMGVKIEIDDFGTGYSSLSRLHRLPATAVKIDRFFVADIEGQGRVIVESAILIAKHMGMAVVAEGVESSEQAERLRALGVDYMQGYLFGRPMPIGEHGLPKFEGTQTIRAA